MPTESEAIPEKRVVVSQVRLFEWQHAEVKRRAAERGISQNEVILRALTYAFAATGASYKVTTEVNL